MKKLFVFILIVVLGVVGYWVYVRRGTKTNTSTTSPTSYTSTYKNSNLGISFTYSKGLAVSDTSSEVTLHHEVPFVHHDYCDFKGEATTTIAALTDFNAKIHVVNKSLIDAMKSESSYIPSENFVNGTVVPSPGFIDPVQAGPYSGFSIFEGAEGCGQTIYYLKVTDSKTLVVTNDLITVFTGAIDKADEDKALAVPGVINKTLNQNVLQEILRTISVN